MRIKEYHKKSSVLIRFEVVARSHECITHQQELMQYDDQ
jgi:hypothetical protein